MSEELKNSLRERMQRRADELPVLKKRVKELEQQLIDEKARYRQLERTAVVDRRYADQGRDFEVMIHQTKYDPMVKQAWDKFLMTLRLTNV
jgi:predicted nuclease with TOPRIM domain